MNEIVNKFLLTGDKNDLIQPEFTYSTSGPFTQNKRRMQNFKETGYSIYSYENDLYKVCFQYHMAYVDFRF